MQPIPSHFPRYYHTLFTHSLSKALRTLADQEPSCVDILMNFLVAAATKLPPIKVPYRKQLQEARPLAVRMDRIGDTGLGPVREDFLTIKSKSFFIRGYRMEGECPLRQLSSSSSLLGAWTGATAGLHQPGGGRVWLHAPGTFPPPSGTSALQGSSVRAAEEISQPGEALEETSEDLLLSLGHHWSEGGILRH